MNFEEALKHCQEGTATEEEIAYVNAQTKAASSLFDAAPSAAPIAPADANDVKKAKKKFKMRYILIPVLVIVLCVAAIGAILGGVFGSAASYANKQIKFGKDACIVAAQECAFADATLKGVTINPQTIRVDRKDIKKDFEYNDSNLKDSYYTYYIELKAYGNDATGRLYEVEYEIRVDTRNGNATVVDFDLDRD